MEPLITDGADVHVAVIYPKAIGDLIFVLPALHTLRRGLPLARLTLVCKKKQEPLARSLQGNVVDAVMSFGDEGAGAIRGAIKKAGVSVMVDFAGNDQAGLLMAWMPGKRIRPCWGDCRGMCGIYSPLASTLPPYDRTSHRVDQFLTWTSVLVDAEPEYSFEMYLPPEAEDLTEIAIDRYSLRSGKVVVLNVGASRETKRWPAEHFKVLTEELIKNGFRVVITGARAFKYDGNYDLSVTRQFDEAGLFRGEDCIDFIGEGELDIDLQLQRDAWFLRYSGVPLVTVGNDTGPMHIAGSIGDDAKNQTISLFGPTNLQRYAPYDPSGAYNRVLVSDTCHKLPTGETEVCVNYKRGCGDPQCMIDVTVESVLEAVVSVTGRIGS